MRGRDAGAEVADHAPAREGRRARAERLELDAWNFANVQCRSRFRAGRSDAGPLAEKLAAALGAMGSRWVTRRGGS